MLKIRAFFPPSIQDGQMQAGLNMKVEHGNLLESVVDERRGTRIESNHERQFGSWMPGSLKNGINVHSDLREDCRERGDDSGFVFRGKPQIMPGGEIGADRQLRNL